MDAKKIQKQIKIYIKRVKRKFGDCKIILYGSYAKNQAKNRSDIDLLVISDRFVSFKEKERFDILYELSKGIYPDINAFGVTEEEIKKKKKSRLLQEIIKTGILLQK